MKKKNYKKATSKLPIEEKLSVKTGKESQIFVITTLIAYISIGFIAVSRHEMWRDEIQTWLVGKSSNSIGEFLAHMRSESNPLLWYFSNFILSRFSENPFSAQLFHYIISIGTAYLILQYAPFSKIQKILLCFSYFIFFEYGIIARGYALTVFFIFLFCVAYSRWNRNGKYVLLSAILFLMANTTGAHGVIFSFSLFILLAVNYYYSKDLRSRISFGHVILSTGITMVGIYIAMKFISPPDNSDRANTWFTQFDLERFLINLKTFFASYFPVPDLSTKNFWNSNMVLFGESDWFIRKVNPVLVVLALIYFLCIFSERISVAIFYVTVTLGIFTFSYANSTIFVLQAARHYGFLFIAFVASCWLLYVSSKEKHFPDVPLFSFLNNKFGLHKQFSVILSVLLGFNSVGNIVACSKDFEYSFSNIKHAGMFIKESNLLNMPTAGFTDYAVSPITAFTGKPIYYPDRDTTHTFTLWTTSRYSTDGNTIFSRLANYISSQKDSSLVILNFKLNTAMIGNIVFNKKAEFEGSVVNDENYFIYTARKFDLTSEIANLPDSIPESHLPFWISIARTSVQNGNTDIAERISFNISRKKYLTPPLGFHHLNGLIKMKKNLPVFATKEFQKELAINPSDAESYFQLGMVYYQQQQMDSAIYAWEKTISLNPNNLDAFSNLGVCYLNFKKNFSKAEEYWNKTLRLNPNYLQAYFNLMILCQTKGDENCMLNYLRAAIKKGISIQEIKNKGIIISDELLSKVN